MILLRMKVVVLILAYGAIVGCGLRGSIGTNVSPVPTGVAPTWPFWPESVRVHPLSRVVTEDDGTSLLETRIEMSDADGATSKGLGVLRVELSGDRPNAALAVWERDLNDLELNRLHFDDVTRTYLLRLEVTEEQLRTPAIKIRATLLTPDGQLLDDEATIPTSRPTSPPTSPAPSPAPSPATSR